MITDTHLNRVEQALREALASEVPLLATASDHIVRAGGKRLRPRVVLLAFQALSDDDIAPAVPLAAAVELLHTASLIHDDINDHSALRRGRPTISGVWGEGLALLVGDFVFVKLLDLIAGLEPWALPLLSKACLDLVEGETRQMVAAREPTLTEETYLSIVAQKTAALFAACGELGARAAGGSPEAVEALRDYGYNVGMAFQLRDDALDLVGDPEVLGKPVAADLQEGKMSLAVLAALREAPDTAEAFESGDRALLRKRVREAGGLEYATRRAQTFGEQAAAALEALPDTPARDALHDLAALAWQRDR